MSERTPIDVDQLRRLEPLSALSNERLRELVSLAYVEPLILGVSVFREGDVDNQTVYLVSGDVQLRSSDGSIDRAVTSRSEESRFPLDDSQPRQSSCTTLTHVEIVRIDNSVLDYMMMWDQLAESPVEPPVEMAEEGVEDKTDTETRKPDQPDIPIDSSAPGRVSPVDASDTTSTSPAATQSQSEVATEKAQPETAMAGISPGENLSPTIAREPGESAPSKVEDAPVSASPAGEVVETMQRPIPPAGPETSPPAPATTPAATASPKPGRPGEWIRKMHHIMAFKNLPPANVKALLEKMQRMPLKSGETVVQQGEVGDYYYVLVDGEAAVTRTIDLAALSPGASFGEESLVSGAERNATVTMKTDGAVMRLSKDDFNELLREPMVNRVSPDEARSQVLMGAIWLDVRHAREYQHGHFRGALNMPLHEMRLRMDELDSNVHYICCCRTGHRSSAAAFLLVQKGFRASVLTGGIQVMPQDLQKDLTQTPGES